MSETKPTAMSDTKPTAMSDTKLTAMSETKPTAMSVRDSVLEIIKRVYVSLFRYPGLSG